MDTFGFVRTHLDGSSRFHWPQLAPNDLQWPRVNPSGPQWAPMGSSGSQRYPVDAGGPPVASNGFQVPPS
eukprot:4530668-Lingulodinium_polyedra.AAC.1